MASVVVSLSMVFIINSLFLELAQSIEAYESNCTNKIQQASPYELSCCAEENRRKTIVQLTGDTKRYIICPKDTPTSCSNVQFPSTCYNILTRNPGIKSGYYKIQPPNDTSAISVYCNMEAVKCDGGGGWMRVAYLDMSDPSQQCPPGFKLYEQGGTRACGRQSGPGCQSVEFPSNNITYNQVCGRVIGYQKGSPDAFDVHGPYNNLEQEYVDGVSITVGHPREHIWTYAAALIESYIYLNSGANCPCSPGATITTQSFVSENYYCESAVTVAWNNTKLYTSDPLWDGKQCGEIEEDCCNDASIPWFNRQLLSPTDENVELRVCGDQSVENEDVPVSYYEIFVK